MRHTRIILLALSVLTMEGFSFYSADVDAEHAALAQIVTELKELNKLIDRAEREADPTARITFQYDWLRRDLKLVRRGIQDHFDTPSSEPREFEPLQGDYRQ
ncbi:MAG: conjugal transfer protein [Gammaproteobacteria bacterium]|nr:conjugal transfer protein [Gammaproteobacteria bacterium]